MLGNFYYHHVVYYHKIILCINDCFIMYIDKFACFIMRNGSLVVICEKMNMLFVFVLFLKMFTFGTNHDSVVSQLGFKC